MAENEFGTKFVKLQKIFKTLFFEAFLKTIFYGRKKTGIVPSSLFMHVKSRHLFV